MMECPSPICSAPGPQPSSRTVKLTRKSGNAHNETKMCPIRRKCIPCLAALSTISCATCSTTGMTGPGQLPTTFTSVRIVCTSSLDNETVAPVSHSRRRSMGPDGIDSPANASEIRAGRIRRCPSFVVIPCSSIALFALCRAAAAALRGAVTDETEAAKPPRPDLLPRNHPDTGQTAAWEEPATLPSCPAALLQAPPPDWNGTKPFSSI
jgi:hypothetical protein